MNQFRNFSTREISFCAWKNIIIGKNGHGKSNILEALSLPIHPMVETHLNYLVSQGSDLFFLRYIHESWELAYSYESTTMKRRYIVNGKSTTKQKLRSQYPHIVCFHPFLMNLMYLGPSERRSFLDTILSQTFPEYEKILQLYKKIVAHRNKVLKNISEGKSQISELDFWDTKFIESAKEVYRFRKKIVDFFAEQSRELKRYFFGKVQSITFEYLSKIDISSPWENIAIELWSQRNKELLLRKTLRWPHLDDFRIVIDSIPLTHFASRGEVKSILLGLKFTETSFIETFSQKKEILFLVDDLLSELDEEHRTMLWEHIGERQCIVTSIEDFEVSGNKIFI